MYTLTRWDWREGKRKTIRGHNGGGRRSVRPSVCLSVSGDNMELSRREAMCRLRNYGLRSGEFGVCESIVSTYDR